MTLPRELLDPRPAPPAPVVHRGPVAIPVQPVNDPAYMARVWDLIREEEHRHAALANTAPVAWTHAPAPMPGAHQVPAAPAVPAWVWKYSALSLSTGGTLALTGWGIGQLAPALPHLETLLYAIAALGLALTVGIGWLRTTLTSHRHAAPTQITQHVTATGLFGRAHGTIHHH
ncbi:hypothetical protein ABT112_06625 [Streptomyces sp. NPDC002055]|uniref:hypothetical protein n=1 Tax=Streptomyces sp. NPDC002055 TaxID=3154534 RepID=UPI00332CED84